MMRLSLYLMLLFMHQSTFASDFYPAVPSLPLIKGELEGANVEISGHTRVFKSNLQSMTGHPESLNELMISRNIESIIFTPKTITILPEHDIASPVIMTNHSSPPYGSEFMAIPTGNPDIDNTPALIGFNQTMVAQFKKKLIKSAPALHSSKFMSHDWSSYEYESNSLPDPYIISTSTYDAPASSSSNSSHLISPSSTHSEEVRIVYNTGDYLSISPSPSESGTYQFQLKTNEAPDNTKSEEKQAKDSDSEKTTESEDSTYYYGALREPEGVQTASVTYLWGLITRTYVYPVETVTETVHITADPRFNKQRATRLPIQIMKLKPVYTRADGSSYENIKTIPTKVDGKETYLTIAVLPQSECPDTNYRHFYRNHQNPISQPYITAAATATAAAGALAVAILGIYYAYRNYE